MAKAVKGERLDAPEPSSASNNKTAAAGKSSSGLDRFFKISERGSTVGTEIRGGVVTFFAMAYIIILNPLILGTTADHSGNMLGPPVSQR